MSADEHETESLKSNPMTSRKCSRGEQTNRVDFIRTIYSLFGWLACKWITVNDAKETPRVENWLSVFVTLKPVGAENSIKCSCIVQESRRQQKNFSHSHDLIDLNCFLITYRSPHVIFVIVCFRLCWTFHVCLSHWTSFVFISMRFMLEAKNMQRHCRLKD